MLRFYTWLLVLAVVAGLLLGFAGCSRFRDPSLAPGGARDQCQDQCEARGSHWKFACSDREGKLVNCMCDNDQGHWRCP